MVAGVPLDDPGRDLDLDGEILVRFARDFAFQVLTGHATAADYVVRFLVPTFLGNAAGGTILAALLNHAPLAEKLTEAK